MKKDQIELLISFLKMTRDEVFEWFIQNKPKDLHYSYHPNFPRFLLIEPTKVNPALLVSHVDTVWGFTEIRPKRFGDVIYSESTEESFISGDWVENLKQEGVGLGADDRVGCFIISQLLNTGNGILLTEGEEIGLGSILLGQVDIIQRATHRHSFAIEFDRQGSSDLIFYNNENDGFRDFIASYFRGYEDVKGSFSDIKPICEYRIPSVNVSCGYYKQHTACEYLKLSEVEQCLIYAKKLLGNNWINSWNFK